MQAVRLLCTKEVPYFYLLSYYNGLNLMDASLDGIVWLSYKPRESAMEPRLCSRIRRTFQIPGGIGVPQRCQARHSPTKQLLGEKGCSTWSLFQGRLVGTFISLTSISSTRKLFGFFPMKPKAYKG